MGALENGKASAALRKKVATAYYLPKPEKFKLSSVLGSLIPGAVVSPWGSFSFVYGCLEADTAKIFPENS